MNSNNVEISGNFSFIKDCIFNYRVLLYALIRVLKNTYIVFLVLAIPAYFTTSSMEFITKVVVFTIIFIVLVLLCLIYCFLKQWFYIKTDQESSEFYSLSPKEKGIIIGDVLKGAY